MSAGNELQAMIARARALASESMVSFSPTPSSYIGESSRQTSPVEGAATSPTSPASVPQAWRPLTLDEFDALLAKVEAKDSLLHDRTCSKPERSYLISVGSQGGTSNTGQ